MHTKPLEGKVGELEPGLYNKTPYQSKRMNENRPHMRKKLINQKKVIAWDFSHGHVGEIGFNSKLNLNKC